MSLKTSLAYSIIEHLELKNRNFCSEDYDYCLKYLSEVLPFDVHKYTEPYNHWQIPPKWDLEQAKILLRGKCIYEVDHPLKIIGLSKPFRGTVSKEELKEHLHFDHRNPKVVPYHFRQFYRPWERDWGFCVPKNFYDSLDEENYEVVIETREEPGSLKVAEFTHKGVSEATFIFVAHLDHPGMANDDLAGVACGVEFFKRLKAMKTKFTYKLLLVPEIIGSEFYLGCTLKNTPVLGGCFLEMLGSKTPLALQRSLNENSIIEQIMLKLRPELKTGPFKSIICNDEAVFESYGHPMCSLSRFPYPEYHSSDDNLSIISEEALEESISLLEKTIESLEKMTLVEKKFTGSPCVSHPDLNLYVDPGQRAFGTHAEESGLQKRLLMDLIFTKKNYFFLDELSKKVLLPKAEQIEYLKLWEKKGLLQLF